MRGRFPQNVELTQKVSLVKASMLAFIAVTKVVRENDKGLDNFRLFRLAGGTENGIVCRHITPAQHAETEGRGKLGKVFLLLQGVLGREKHVAHSIVTRGGESGGKAVDRFTHKEIVRDTSHDSCTIAIASVCTGWEGLVDCNILFIYF